MALKTAIHSILGETRVFFSDESIVAGEAWLSRLQQELAESRFGIIILTPESVKSPWVLMEFGALAKHFGNSLVIPLIIGMDRDELPSPFKIFQGVSLTTPDNKANREAFFHLFESIASFLCKTGNGQHLTLRRVEEAWRTFERELKQLTARIRPWFVTDDTAQMFNAYDGASFESAFFRCLSHSSELKAASLGLAILYRSGRVLDLLETRLLRREIDVELIYANPFCKRAKSMPDPFCKNNLPYATWTENDLDPLVSFLRQFIGKIERAKNAEQHDGNESAVDDVVPDSTDSLLEVELANNTERFQKIEEAIRGLETCHGMDELKGQLAKELIESQAQLNLTQARLRFPIKLKVSFSRLQFFHSVIMFDEDLFVFWYGHNQLMHKEPVLHVHRSQSMLWQYFEEQYEHLRASSLPNTSWNAEEKNETKSKESAWSKLERELKSCAATVFPWDKEKEGK